MSVAGLPWYDFVELRDAVDAMWAGLARALREEGVDHVPDQLQRDIDPAVLLDEPELLWSQTCGWIAATSEPGRFQLVASPVYDHPGCSTQGYSTVIVSADGGFRGRCAVSEPTSYSGHHALRWFLRERGAAAMLDGALNTGSHRRSLATLQQGEANIASIDAIAWALLRRVAPRETEGLEVIGRTPVVPAPPWITSANRDVARLQRALRRFFDEGAHQGARRAVGLVDFRLVTRGDYAVLRQLAAAS